jgi:hypothetical protein
VDEHFVRGHVALRAVRENDVVDAHGYFGSAVSSATGTSTQP